MPSFLFSAGNSSEGPIGICARVKAETPEGALKLLQDALYESAYPEIEISLHDEGGPVEYVNIYLNPERLKVEDISAGETEDDGDEDYCAGDLKPGEDCEGLDPDGGKA